MSGVIKSHRVRTQVPEADAGPVAALPRRQKPCRKLVEPLRVDGRVHAIQLTCSCGEKTVIELSYDDRGDDRSDDE